MTSHIDQYIINWRWTIWKTNSEITEIKKVRLIAHSENRFCEIKYRREKKKGKSCVGTIIKKRKVKYCGIKRRLNFATELKRCHEGIPSKWMFMMIQKKVKYIAFPPARHFNHSIVSCFYFFVRLWFYIIFIYFFDNERFVRIPQVDIGRFRSQSSVSWILSFQVLFDNNNLLLFPMFVGSNGRFDDRPTSDLFGSFGGSGNWRPKKKKKLVAK